MNQNPNQISLFGGNLRRFLLPVDYKPTRPDYMNVSRIYLDKGSVSTPERRQFIERICCFYPEAEVNECLDTPHNRIELDETDALALHHAGKKTLVFG